MATLSVILSIVMFIFITHHLGWKWGALFVLLESL